MIHTVQELPVAGKRVLVRVDFNVPLDANGAIVDDSRIKAALPTIKNIIDRGGKVVLLSHLGRPKGKTLSCSLKPCADRLSLLLQKPVRFLPDCIGDEVKTAVFAMGDSDVVLLENVRFYDGEEHPEKDPSFVEKVASLGQMYVNDAFGAAHRAHATTALLASYFPNAKAAGMLMMKEIHALSEALMDPKHLFVAIIGGSKISTKLGVLLSLLKKVDVLLIGGAMAFTFMKAEKIPIGISPCEDDMLEKARQVIDEAKKSGKQLLFPIDLIVTETFADNAPYKIVDCVSGIPDGFAGMDIGPRTCIQWDDVIKKAKTIFWNGPVGVYEFPNFAKGTKHIAQSIASNTEAFSVVGGGDSIAAVEASGLSDKISHVSTGGGASIEFLEQGTLPGLEALEE